jgi:hypothetical protein
MKRLLLLLVITLISLTMVTIALGETNKLNLKVGDEIYVCNCGPSCPCQTMSRRASNCTCGNEMVKVKVTKVEKDLAYVQAPAWEKARAFNTVGKYACACEPSCDCNTISQNPGKCVCGKEMKEVK